MERRRGIYFFSGEEWIDSLCITSIMHGGMVNGRPNNASFPPFTA